MKRRIIYHIAFWIGYVLFKSYLNVESAITLLTFPTLVMLISSQSIFLLIKIPMVYTLFYLVEKYLSKQWGIGKTILSILALFSLGVILFIPLKLYVVMHRIYKIDGTLAESFNFGTVIYTLFLLGFTCSVAIAIKLIRTNIRQREAKQEITQRKLETELRFLKAQVNPHFLFNTLNNIYALARKRSEDTADVVMKLSKLLRFILYESQKKQIMISNELQVLENYIELESIRYHGKLRITFTKSIDNAFQLIAPLILLPFVENTFKHGVSESRFNSYINIDLRLKHKHLYFMCENSKTEDAVDGETGNIGLTNIRRQLELLYPEHTLEIENTHAVFKIILNVNLATQKAPVTIANLVVEQ